MRRRLWARAMVVVRSRSPAAIRVAARSARRARSSASRSTPRRAGSPPSPCRGRTHDGPLARLPAISPCAAALQALAPALHGLATCATTSSSPGTSRAASRAHPGTAPAPLAGRSPPDADAKERPHGHQGEASGSGSGSHCRAAARARAARRAARARRRRLPSTAARLRSGWRRALAPLRSAQARRRAAGWNGRRGGQRHARGRTAARLDASGLRRRRRRPDHGHGLRHCRQPHSRAGRVGRRGAGQAHEGAPGRGVRHGRARLERRGDRDAPRRPRRLAPGRRRRGQGRRPGTRRAARRGREQAGRAVRARSPPPALRRLHEPGRRWRGS